MNNLLVAIQMAMQSLQMLQQVQQLMQVAATEGRDLTDAELNQVVQSYADTHSKVDAFILAHTTKG